MIWGVVIDGRVAHLGSFGVRDRASQAPITPDTAFRIASMTKSFTALAVLKLRDDGRLSLEIRCRAGSRNSRGWSGPRATRRR